MNYAYKIESVFESDILLALEQVFYSIKGRKSEPALWNQGWWLTVQDYTSIERDKKKKKIESEYLLKGRN